MFLKKIVVLVLFNGNGCSHREVETCAPTEVKSFVHVAHECDGRTYKNVDSIL